MAKNVVVSKGAKVKIKVGSTFVAIGAVTDVNSIGGGSNSIIDTTDLDSTAIEKKQGLPDFGSITISGNYIEDDAGQEALQTARNSSDPVEFEITAGNTKWTLEALVSTHETSFSTNEKVTWTASLEVSGAPARSKINAGA